MTEWVTVKVPESDRDECKEIRPDSATFGDCIVAGAKSLSDGDVILPNQTDAEDIADEIVGRIDMTADPGTVMSDSDVADLAEQVRKLQRLVENTPENTAERLRGEFR